MKKFCIFIVSIIMSSTILPAALIPPKISSLSTKAKNKALHMSIGKEKADQVNKYLQQGRKYWNFYWESILRPSNMDLKKHSLWYGLKSGNTRSLSGEDPAKFIKDYYNYMKQNWYKNTSDNFKIHNANVIKEYNKAYENYHLAYDEESKNKATQDLVTAGKKLVQAVNREKYAEQKEPRKHIARPTKEPRF